MASEGGGSVRPHAEPRGKGVRLQVEPEGVAMVWKVGGSARPNRAGFNTHPRL